MSATAPSSATPDPALRIHAQAFYDAVRTNNIAVMDDMVNKGFPLGWAHAFSPESLPEYALAHKAPDAAWWLLAHDVAPASWPAFATKAGRSFLSYGLDLVLHRSSTVSPTAYVRLAARLAREAGGQLPVFGAALFERLALKEAAKDIRDEALNAATDLRNQGASVFESMKEQGRTVLGEIRQAAQSGLEAAQQGLDTPEVKKAVNVVKSWRDRLLDSSAGAALRKAWDEKVAPVLNPEQADSSKRPADTSAAAPAAAAPPPVSEKPADQPVGRPLPVHHTEETPAAAPPAPRAKTARSPAKAAVKSPARKTASKTAKSTPAGATRKSASTSKPAPAAVRKAASKSAAVKPATVKSATAKSARSAKPPVAVAKKSRPF